MGNIFAHQATTTPPKTPDVLRHVQKAVPPPAVASIEIINNTKRTEEKFGSREATQ